MFNKSLKFLLSMMMVLCTLTINSVKAADAKYTIYPTPQEITYNDEKSFTLSSSMNIVYSQDIDKYTKNHVNDVLTILKKSGSESTSIAADKTNVLVGIYGKDDAVNDYFTKNSLIKDAKFFNKFDAYILSVKDGVIAILGRDTDAAFHGVTTLKHIFNQIKDNQIKELVMNDFADVKSRGFIEGYYGNPWSNEDRADLMTYGGDYKLNEYVYAPKDDPKHNRQWKAMYTDEELKAIGKLAETGNQNKCYYVYALHPFMADALRFDTDEHYNEDLNIIKTKFTQLMNVGVKQFAILADDAATPIGGGASYVRLMTDLTNWLKEKQKTVAGLKTDMIFCPSDYYGNGTSSQLKELKEMPSNVSIIQTGGAVWGSVNNDFLDRFIGNVGTAPFLWINWPCSDNTKDGLIMGGAERFLKIGADASKVKGIILNPMQQSEASKQGLFANADYSWKIWQTQEDADKNWHDSFNYMDHGTIEDTKSSIALREISKHMKNSNTGIPESEELGPKLNAFISDFEAGKDIKAQAEELKAEFKVLQDAAAYYKANPGNTRTRDQIIYWLNCWQDTTVSITNYLDAAIALQAEDDNATIWDLFANGQAAFEKSQTYSYYYVDHYEHAKVGRQHIYPFMKKLDQILSVKVSTIVDPNIQIVSYITNRSDTPDGNINSVFDNKASTEIVYKNPNSISTGTYVGISYTKAIDIDKVIFRLGANSNLKDTFSKAKVQYTTDGKEWKDLDDKIYELPNEVVLKDLGLKGVKGIRMIATADKGNTWLGIRDIVVNPTEEEQPVENKTTVTVDKIAARGGSLNNVIDEDMTSYAHFAEYPYKPAGATYEDYIPVDATVTLTFDQPKLLGSILFKQASGTDKITKYVFEYSVDGKEWKEIKTYNGDAEVSLDVSSQNIKAKAVRVRNLELNLKDAGHGYWWQLFNFNVTEQNQKVEPKFEYTPRWKVYDGTVSNLIDDNNDTALDFDTQPSTQKGDYIGWDLGKVIEVGKVHAVIGGNRSAGDKWEKYSLQYSVDGTTWETYKSYTGVAEGKDYIDENLNGVNARYVRLVNLEDKNAWIIFSEFSVKEFDLDEGFTTDHIYSNTKNNIKANVEEATAKLMALGNVTLKENEFVGVDLTRIKDLKEINIDSTANDKLTVQVSKNKVDWQTLNAKSLPDARYVRLINLNKDTVTFTLKEFTVTSNEVSAPFLYETTMGIESSWGVAEDSRYNGAAFDGNVDTTTEFGDLPQKGQYIIYDLGQVRDISKLAMFCQDSAVNYIRDADILISNDLENWTKVVTIGDGVENKGDANIICGDSDAGYKASSKYPNKVYVEGQIDTTKARYVKILMTASNNNRAVVFNEIVINDGEYVPVMNDPTFDSNVIEVQGYQPQNMFDGDLTTSYKPNTTKAGYIQYTLSDNLDVKKYNIVQKGTITNAKVMAYVEHDGKREWVQVGTLSKSLNEIYLPFNKTLELKIVWEEGQVPTISEVVAMTQDEYLPGTKELEKYITSLDVKEEVYTASSYKVFSSKLKNAKDVLDNTAATKEDVAKVYRELQLAQTALVVRGDIEKVNQSLESINKLDKTLYTEESWQALQDVVIEANKLLEKDAAEITEREVVEIVEKLAKQQSQLITVAQVNKESLAQYIDSNKLNDLDTTLYLTKTADPFKEALKAANDILKDESATADAIKEAHTALQKARGELVLKATTTELKGLKALADVYKEEDYTKASWAEFKPVLDKVNKVVKENESTSAEISSLIDELKAAAKKLVVRSDTSGVEALINLVKTLDKNKYTEDSYNTLIKEMNAIEKQLENASEMSQKDVDALELQLQKAINQLKARPQDPEKPDNPNNGGQNDKPDNNKPNGNQGNNQNNTPNNNQNNNQQTDTSTQTSDDTAIISFVALALLAIAGFWMSRKKED
ncbi:beta-N-acetylglucosaminidase domain-containing protein [Longibaculum muris]|uniref:beta-N-acetylglucosaminidase domain-containing protein n=1 Tax=Longibaculum muris TaxID=1796628 RepID=UPI00189D0CEC|nr:beta-N-acetylglucosaminidase domain-containing protein [Longibaculum muris]